MSGRLFYTADGEPLIVPQQGRLTLVTEMGILAMAPGEIGVVPRGIRFRAELSDGAARGACLRELRRALPPTRARADRSERPCQPA